jgi:hypothetical protein
MMRLGRRASLLVVLSLLTSAATAYAECAWVLWQERPARSRRFALDNDRPGVFRVQRECEAVAENKNQAEAMPRDEQTRRRLPQGRWLCLPDTVDPRGPKGK